MQTKWAGLISAIFLMIGVSSWAQTAEVTPTTLRVTDVAVFKHGYGFIMAEGQAQTKDGWALLSAVPQAALGTLWLYSPQEGVTVDRMVAQVQEGTRKQPAEDLDGLILANVGSKVMLSSSYGGTDEGVKTYTGTLLPPLLGPRNVQYGSGSSGQLRHFTDEQLIWAAVPPRSNASDKVVTYVVVKQIDAPEIAIPRGQVREINFLEGVKREAEISEPQQRLAARLVSGGKTVTGETKLGAGYLAKGLRWIPAYRLQLQSGNQARLQLQGNIINDVTDLQDSRLHLVVGVPHFVQEDVVSPLSLQVAWTQLSSYFAPIQRRALDTYSNALMSQSSLGDGGPLAAVTQPIGFGMPGMPDTSRAGQNVQPVSGEGLEDLFFYQVPGVTLKRGSRAAVSILEQPVTYEDVYLWKIVDDDDYAAKRWSISYQQQHPNYNSGQRPTPEQEALTREMTNPKVWHALRLTNRGSAPWTTAPTLIVRDWQPLAQSMMLYTPIGGTMDLTTTVAPDLSTDRNDLEVARETNARQVSGYHYDCVTVKGELRITNRKRETAHLLVTRQFEGMMSEITEGGQAVKLAEGNGLNPTTRATWDCTLPAGTQKVLEYRYTVYVRL